MQIALDENNKRISIDYAIENETKNCRCQFCKSQLTIRNGEIRIPHFAHKKGTMWRTDCDPFWGERKLSEWYYKWMSAFTDESREQIVEDEKTGEKHIADLRVDNFVVFFVDGKMNISDFQKQNRFFVDNGYCVKWVFREIDEFKEKKLGYSWYGNSRRMYWKWPRKTLNNYKPSTGVVVYLQLKEEEQLLFARVDFVNGNNMGDFEVELIEVKSKIEFVDYLKKEEISRRNEELSPNNPGKQIVVYPNKASENIRNSVNKIRRLNEKDSSQNELVDFYMCDSSFGKEAHEVKHAYPENCLYKDIIEEEGDYGICRICKYHLRGHKIPEGIYQYATYTMCTSKFRDMNLLPSDHLVISRNDEGIIDIVEVVRGDEVITYPFTETERMGKTLFELWESSYERMRVLNLKNGWKFQLKDPNKMAAKYNGKVYPEKICKPGENKFDVPEKMEIKGAGLPIWQLLWHPPC